MKDQSTILSASEMNYLQSKFGVSKSVILEAISAVGSRFEQILAYLLKNKYINGYAYHSATYQMSQRA